MGRFSDTFDRANNAALGNGWTDAVYFPAEGPVDYFSIDTNKAKISEITGGPNGGAKAGNAGRFQNWDITVSVTRDAGSPWMGIIARAVQDNSFYYFILRGGSGDWNLRSILGGTVTVLASGLFTWNVGQTATIRLSIQDDKIKVFINGSQQGSTITDVTLQGAGDAGLYAAVGVGGSGTFNDFASEGYDPLIYRSSGAGVNHRFERRHPLHTGYTTPSQKWSNTSQGAVTIVMTATHIYFTDGNILKKVDPDTGVTVASRDFGAALAGHIAAANVEGVDRIYLLTSIASAAPVVHCVRADDLTDIWTRTLAQAVNNSIFAHDTASGVLVTTVDSVSPNTVRASRDDGTTFTALWTSTVIPSNVQSSSPGGTRIYAGNGTNFTAALAANGTQSWSVAGHPGGTAPFIDPTDTYGYARINPLTDLRKFLLSTGATEWTLVQPFGSGNNIAAEPAIDHRGIFVIWSGTSVKAYTPGTTSPALQWTYAHFETVVNVVFDEHGQLLIASATKLQCRKYADQSLVWETSTTAAVTVRVRKPKQMFLLQAGKSEGYEVVPGRTRHQIGVISGVLAGSEGVPIGNGFPQQRTFMSPSGQPLSLYILPTTITGSLRAAWRHAGFGILGAGFDLWSGENVIDTFSVGSTSPNAWGLSGWMDGSDHVYVAYFGRLTSQKIGFVKLTRTANGWTQGTVVTVNTTQSPDEISICKVPTSGRIWIFYTRTGGGNYGSFYSDNDGASWTAGPDFGASIVGSQSPIFATAWANKVLMVRKTTTPAIVAKERNDSDAPTTWSADTSLYSGAQVNSTDTWHHVIHLRYAGHASATVLLALRTSDEVLRIKKYLDGTGWISGDTQYSTQTPLSPRAAWDPTENKLLAWDTSPPPVPQYYDPGTNGLTETTLDNPSASVGSPMRDRRWYAAESPGYNTLSIPYFLEEAAVPSGVLSVDAFLAVEARAAIFRLPQVPVEMRRTLFVDRRLEVAYLLNTQVLVDPRLEVEFLRAAEPIIFPIPAEWDGTEQLRLAAGIPVEAIKILLRDGAVPVESILQLRHPTGLEVEARAGLRYGTEIPVEFTGSIAVLAPSEIPVEARGGAAAGATVQVEASGLLVIRSDHTLSLETIGRLVWDAVLDVEASGAGLSIVHVWKVLRKLTEPFLHEWIVVPVAGTFSIQHQWTVRQILGGSLPHTWRVLPQELVTAFSDDIQLPYGKAEK